MSLHRQLRPLAVVLLLGAVTLAAASCQKSGGGSPQGRGPDMTRLFGNGFKDATPVICKVGNIEITQGDFDKSYAEQPANVKARYSGEGWERRYLATMVDDALLANESLNRHLDRDPEIAQALISDRRLILANAMRVRDLTADLKPTEQQVRDYYEQNKSTFTQLGSRLARHIQTRDRKTALEAYDAVRGGMLFPYAVSKFSVNAESAQKAGDLGWFNKGGFMPAVPYGKELSETVWDWPVGLHEPVQIHGDWHVIEILRRTDERPLTLDEARDQIVQGLLPRLKQERLDTFLKQARQQVAVEYFGQYKPGGGRSPQELLKAAQLANTPEQQIDICKQILDDFPDSEYGDDALFLMANVYIDRWDDVPSATDCLSRLIREHPDSELRQQAQYLLDNCGKPGFWKPGSLEELRKAAEKAR